MTILYCITCLMLFFSQPDAGASISYPDMDEPPPPSYEATSTTQTSGIGQLIDLGTDITAPPTGSEPQGARSDDIVAQLAQLGVTTEGTAQDNGVQSQIKSTVDEFDMFAESRTAYGTQKKG